MPFISRTETVLQANEKDLDNVKIKFRYIFDDSTEDQTHRFYEIMNCLGLKKMINGAKIDLQLFAAFDISTIPFTIDVIPESMQKTSAEMIIMIEDQQKIKDIEVY